VTGHRPKAHGSASTSSLASVRGAWRGRVDIADDFDDLPPDIAEALGGE